MSLEATMNFLKNKYVKYTMTALVVVAVGWFFYGALHDNWEAVSQIELVFNWQSVVATLFFIGAVIVSGLLWGLLLDELTMDDAPRRRLSAREAIRVHIASWLLKYIPGQAGSAVNKILWATKNGYSKKLVLITFIYENTFLLTASFLLAIPLLMAMVDGEASSRVSLYLLVSLAFILIAAVLMNNRVMHKVFSFAFNKALRQPVSEKFFLNSKQLLKMQAYFLVPRIINGIGFVFVTASFLHVSGEAYIPLAAAYILAGAIGILAIFVPSGIGVREAVIVLFAGQFMPVEQAILAALAARLYSTVADGVLAVGYGALSVKTRKERYI